MRWNLFFVACVMFTFKTSLNTNKQKLKPQFCIKAYEFSYIEVDVDIRKNKSGL